MKNKNSLSIVIVIGALLIIGATVYFVRNMNNFNWYLNFLPDSKEPYGTYIVREMLEETNDITKFEFIDDSTHKRIRQDLKLDGNAYVFIGNEFFAEKEDMKALLEFASSGNDIFISANNFESSFYYYLYNYLNDKTISKTYDPYGYSQDIIVEDDTYEDDYDDYDDYDDEEEVEEEYYATEQEDYYYNQYIYYNAQEYADEITTTLEHSFGRGEENYSYLYDFDTIPNHWTYFNSSFFDLFSNHEVERLGTLHAAEDEYSNYSNFVAIHVGKGKIYLHCTPLIFTNYFMKNEDYMRFAEKHFSYLKEGNLYWAEENRTYIFESESQEREKRVAGESALEFILSEPALRWAYYLTLLVGVLYLIFGARRKQRVIPVQLAPENTSIEYAEVVSQLFFKQSDHYKLIQMKMELFRSHLLDRYQLRIPVDLNDREKFYKIAAIKTGVSQDHIKQIFIYYTMAEASRFADAFEMVQFHKSLEIFYQISR